MRFLQFEHRDLKAAVEAAGLDFGDFRSVKRQGKVHLYYKDRAAPFRFFRKKETKLAAGKWESCTQYLIYEDGKGVPVGSWEVVKEAFVRWLGTL